MAISRPDSRRGLTGMIAVWAVAAVSMVVIGVFSPIEGRAAWATVALGGCLVLSFAVQFVDGNSQHYTQRVAAGVVGSLVVTGLIWLGFGLATVVPA